MIPEIFQNQEPYFQHIRKFIAEHCMQFLYIAVGLERPIAGVQYRSVCVKLIGSDI